MHLFLLWRLLLNKNIHQIIEPSVALFAAKVLSSKPEQRIDIYADHGPSTSSLIAGCAVNFSVFTIMRRAVNRGREKKDLIFDKSRHETLS